MDPTGEVLEVPERVVIAPSTGRVVLPPIAARAEEGEFVLVGDTVATVLSGASETPVRTAFRGWLMGFLVLDGQPIRSGDAVAWLRSA